MARTLRDPGFFYGWEISPFLLNLSLWWANNFSHPPHARQRVEPLPFEQSGPQPNPLGRSSSAQAGPGWSEPGSRPARVGGNGSGWFSGTRRGRQLLVPAAAGDEVDEGRNSSGAQTRMHQHIDAEPPNVPAEGAPAPRQADSTGDRPPLPVDNRRSSIRRLQPSPLECLGLLKRPVPRGYTCPGNR
jgi:hypothetical protein